MKVLGIIPARYKSSRFPGKPLVKLLNKPMIIHVAEIAAKALGQENIIVATEDQRIAEVVEQYGFKFELTSDEHPTGTDRLWEVSSRNQADVYINIQGDEPMIDPKDIIKILEAKKANPKYVINGMCPLNKSEDPQNLNIPKVLFDKNKQLIYMSRLAIPGIKGEKNRNPVYWKQVCIYAFDYEQLQAYGQAGKKAEYEYFEDIEILRFFDLGYKIKMVETSGASLAVDVPEDVVIVSKKLREKA